MKMNILCMGLLLSSGYFSVAISAPWLRWKALEIQRAQQARIQVYQGPSAARQQTPQTDEHTATTSNSSSPSTKPQKAAPKTIKQPVVSSTKSQQLFVRQPTHVKGRTAGNVVEMLGELENPATIPLYPVKPSLRQSIALFFSCSCSCQGKKS